jgi:type IV pilus assembly protein PilA
MKKLTQKGFTLIELMIVVAIVGILAVLAVFGVRKYLANAKTAEATNAIGTINQLSINAYEREVASADLKVGLSSTSTHSLCATSTVVPVNTPAAKKYTPSAAKGQDYQDGDSTTSWKCLKYEMNQPQYYSYGYVQGNALPVFAPAGAIPATAAMPKATGWVVAASGDLDGNGNPSTFVMTGDILNGVATSATQIASDNPEE